MELRYVLYILFTYCAGDARGDECVFSENYADCSGLDLTEVPSGLPKSVRILKLDRNSLSEIHLDGVIENLTSLSISHNKLNGLPRILREYIPNLKALNLSHNHIAEIKSGMFPYSSQLVSLNLNNNKIAYIKEGSLDALEHLYELKLSRNNLSVIGKEAFRNLKNLRTLELNKNAINNIGSLTFQELLQLITLKLRQNSIAYLSDGAFYGLSNLRLLRLDYNNITNVTHGWLFGLIFLRELHLEHNRIQFIKEGAWEPCKLLVHLDLSFNELHKVNPTSFKYLSRLQYLNLASNHLTCISEGSFNSTPSLKHLELNNNDIACMVEHMSGGFYILSNLLKLGLAFNKITSVNQFAFIGLNNLIELDLNGNDIKAIEESAFSSTSLKKLHMNTTRLSCDCELAWLPMWLQTSSVELLQAYCAYPEAVNGRKLVSLSPQQFLCTVNERPKPVIREGPKSIDSLSGTKVELKCSAYSSSNSTLNFKWRRNNDDIAPVHSFVTNNTSFLTIPEVTLGDGGRYQCIVSNEFGTTYSSKANITVIVLPIMIKSPGNITVKAGSTARLECAAAGEPTPQVSWQKDGGTEFPAAQERRMHVMPTDDVFFIINTKPADSGLYSCIARNPAGTVVANATLTVLEPPSFKRKLENIQTQLGKSVVFECMVTGWPKPKLSWTKDGTPLKSSFRHFFTADDQLLVIMDVRLSDEGTYECEIVNPLGVEKETSRLTVVSGGYGNTVDNITGLIIITVVCCAVGTSCIWVIIIYHTRKRLKNEEQIKGIFMNGFHLDNKSEHSTSSKDSGTGDSTKRSNDDLRAEPSTFVQEYEGEQRTVVEIQLLPLLNTFTRSDDVTQQEINNHTLPNSVDNEITRNNHDRCQQV